MNTNKIMKFMTQSDQEFIETQQINSYTQFKVAINKLGLKQQQQIQNKFQQEFQLSPQISSPYLISKQDEWQKNQDQIVKKMNDKKSLYFGHYQRQNKQNIEERYLQHNNSSESYDKFNVNQIVFHQTSTLSTPQIPNLNDMINQGVNVKKSNLKNSNSLAKHFKVKKTVKIMELNKNNTITHQIQNKKTKNTNFDYFQQQNNIQQKEANIDTDGNLRQQENKREKIKTVRDFLIQTSIKK